MTWEGVFHFPMMVCIYGVCVITAFAMTIKGKIRKNEMTTWKALVESCGFVNFKVELKSGGFSEEDGRLLNSGGSIAYGINHYQHY